MHPNKGTPGGTAGAPPTSGRPSNKEEDDSAFDADFDKDSMDVLEGPGPMQEKLLDADFFNAFADDFDETDMELQ